MKPKISETCSHAIRKQFDFPAVTGMFVGNYCDGITQTQGHKRGTDVAEILTSLNVGPCC